MGRGLLLVVGTALFALAISGACNTPPLVAKDGGAGPVGPAGPGATGGGATGGVSSAPGGNDQGGGGATGGSAPGAGGTGGAGGAGCASCGDYIVDTMNVVMFEDLCGYDTGLSGCNNNPSSSCNLAAARELCVCGDSNGPGMCNAQCQLTCTGSGMDMSTCQTCATSNCSSETSDCLADPGTP